MSAPVQEVTKDAAGALPQRIQMTMTEQEFGVVSLGLSLVLSVRTHDKGMILHGMTLVARMDGDMLAALDSLAEKIDAGWSNVTVEGA